MRTPWEWYKDKIEAMCTLLEAKIIIAAAEQEDKQRSNDENR